MAAINEEGYGGPVGDMGSTNNVDTLKNIWFDDTEAWEGIDEVIVFWLNCLCLLSLHLEDEHLCAWSSGGFVLRQSDNERH